MTPMAKTLPDILLASDEIDGLLIHGIIDTGWAEMVHPIFKDMFGASLEDLRRALYVDLEDIIRMPEKYGKPVLISSFFGEEDHAVKTFHENHIPTFNTPEKTAEAMAALFQYHLIQNRESEAPQKPHPMPRAAERFMDLDAHHELDEYDAKALLRAYDIGTCREEKVDTVKEALSAAEAIGYPVAVKVCSPRIRHKSEDGLVFLNITDSAGVEKACRRIFRSQRAVPILISEMIEGQRELMAGMTRFPGFPPIIMLGLGGILTEILKDRAVRLAPLSPADGYAMIASLRSSRLLDNYRGMKPTDQKMLVDVLIRLGRMALDFPRIKEIDLNPIIIKDGEPVVVDALMVL
jgi:acetyltransferase